jgi:hypothetical protein
MKFMSKKIQRSIAQALSTKFKNKMFELSGDSFFIRHRPPLHDIFNFGYHNDVRKLNCSIGVGVPAIATEIRGEIEPVVPHQIVFCALSSNVFKNKGGRWYDVHDLGVMVEEVWSDFEQAEPWFLRWESLEQLAEWERKSLRIFPEKWGIHLNMAEIYAVLGDSERAYEALRNTDNKFAELKKLPRNILEIYSYEFERVRKIRDFLAKSVSAT